MMPVIMDRMSQKDSYASDDTLDTIIEIPEHLMVQFENGSDMCDAGSAGDESSRAALTKILTDARVREAKTRSRTAEGSSWWDVSERQFTSTPFSDTSLLDRLAWSCAHQVP